MKDTFSKTAAFIFLVSFGLLTSIDCKCKAGNHNSLRQTDGLKVSVILNNSSSTQTFNMGFKGRMAPTLLSNGAVATFS